ncbi:glycoside hydrolase, partial [Bifidobacterium margollesii]
AAGAVMSGPLLIAVLAVAAVGLALIAILSLLPSLDGSTATGGDAANVPAQYAADVNRAGSICPVVTAPVIAAQIETESDWNVNSGSSAGAQGIAQFIPSTWAIEGRDGDGDGRADVMNPHDAIFSQGHYMCELAAQVETLKRGGAISGDTLQLTLAAYNAGPGAVTQAGGIPAYAETRNYVAKTLSLIPKYTGPTSGTGGGRVGQLDPPMIVQADGYHVDYVAMRAPTGSAPSYPTFQCTWWAAVRRLQIGRPVDPYMGNGGWWNDTARRLHMTVSSSPAPGDVMCFEPGVHGHSPAYGHVAVVEEVRPDGSITISQSGTGYGGVAIERFTAAQLRALGSGISFIK